MTYGILGDTSALEDKLDFGDYSSILFEIISHAETPLTIGIFGPWGTGKSSLMQMLKSKIDSSNSTSMHTLWFNAWKFDREDGLWRAFILRVIDNIRTNIKADINSKETKATIEELDRLEESLYHTVEWQELGKWTLDWSKAVPGAIKGAAELAFMFIPGAAPFIETLTKAREALAEGKPADELEKVMGAFRRQVKEFRREHLRAIEQFEAEFGRIIQSHITNKQGRLIVFVDDLDRCLPEKSIEILEAIKLFLEVPGCVFIVGMDKDVIEKGVAYRYSKHNPTYEGIISGENYLQKMIQLPFHLPELSYAGIQTFIEKLDGQFPQKEQLPLACREIIALGCPANPRQIKRTINLFRMLRAVAELRERRGEFSHQISLPLLAKTIVIQAHFPEFYADWLRFPTLIQHLEASYTSAKGDVSVFSRQSLQMTISSLSMSRLLASYLEDDRASSRLGRVIAFTTNSSDEQISHLQFTGLARSEITTYFYLARTGTEKDLNIERSEGELWHDLMSRDLVQVQDTVEMIDSASSAFRRAFESRLLSVDH
jgi:hypothetical protein